MTIDNMTDQPTPTPRTDAEQQSYWTDYESVEKMWVCILDFARNLERELAAANAELTSAHEAIKVLRKALEYYANTFAHESGRPTKARQALTKTEKYNVD